jgi:hypothetical protein
MSDNKKTWFARLSAPLRVGLACAALGIILAIVGIARGNVPANPLSIFLALLISGGSWGVVSWAVATAAMDVEKDAAAEAGTVGSERPEELEDRLERGDVHG